MSDTPLSPPESISGKPIRRRYSLALKKEIVEASLRPGVSAAQVARQYGLNETCFIRGVGNTETVCSVP